MGKEGRAKEWEKGEELRVGERVMGGKKGMG